MLHRVLPEQQIAEFGANPEWAMTPEVFNDFLEFVKRYYTPVSVEEIDESFKKLEPLPDNAILITFDDGWLDNHQYAFKYLQNHQVPSLFFIVTNTIDQQLPFWQELVYSCCSKSNTNFSHCAKLANIENCDSILTLISELSNNANQIQFRDKVVNYCSDVLRNMPRQLMNEQEILELYSQQGFTIGSHGASHEPLGDMGHEDQRHEINASRDALERFIPSNIQYLSFPHGSNNSETLSLCQQAGYSLIFDSRVAINSSKSSKLARVHVSQRSITEKGKFDLTKAAYRLFFLPHV